MFSGVHPHWRWELQATVNGRISIQIDEMHAYFQAKATNKHDLPCINDSLDGRPAFNTGDILIPHAVQGGRWKVLGSLSQFLGFLLLSPM